MPHYCHATGCQTQVKPSLLMCKKHWSLVPDEIQKEVWKHYRKGQEVDKKPSEEYLRAQMVAVNHVAFLEGSPVCDIEARIILLKKHGLIQERGNHV